MSLWWVVGLRLQGAYGLPILQLTETVRTVAADSSPTDILRGIGNWFFYGKDRLGYSIDQAAAYANNVGLQVVTFAIPVVALGARRDHAVAPPCLLRAPGGRRRGRLHRRLALRQPEPLRRAVQVVRRRHRGRLGAAQHAAAVPLLVLGLAGLVAAGVSALIPRLGSWWPPVLVGLLALAALAPVLTNGFLSRNLDRPESVPQYWKDAIAAMSREGNSTRILEIPGSDFSAYRWGDTIEPITPGLTDRPYVARETLPSGSAPSVNLLVALDHRLQDGTFEPDALAAYARLANIGTVSLRSDLQYERFDTPRPRLLWQQLVDPLPKGLDVAARLRPPNPEPRRPPVSAIDSTELAIPVDAANPPPVALFDVKDAIPIVHSAPTRNPCSSPATGRASSTRPPPG